MKRNIISIFSLALVFPCMLCGCDSGGIINPAGSTDPGFSEQVLETPEPVVISYNEYENLEYEEGTKAKKTVKAEFSYDYNLPEDQKGVLEGAAAVNVLDCEYPLKLTVTNATGTALSYKCVDLYENEIFSGTIPAEGGTAILTKGIYNHPTGYFTLSVGDDFETSYVVVPAFSQRIIEDTPFAMDYASTYLVSNTKNVFRVAAAAKISGVTWVRERANWTSYEASEGKYSYTSTKNAFNAVKQAGLKNLAMLCVAPSWAYKNEDKSTDLMQGGFRTTHLNIYNLCRDMAKEYEGIVDGWELWNESDYGFAAEPAELFAGWFKSGALGLKDSGAAVTVSYGGYCMWPGQTDNDYMPISLQNDIMTYSDIYNFHAHVAYTGSYVDYLAMPAVSYQLEMSRTYNIQNKPIWVTEAGMQMNVSESDTKTPTKTQLRKQCPYIVQSTCLSLSQGVSRHFWFVLSPYIENGGDFGTFSSDYTPYPTLAAEAVLTGMLGLGKYRGYLKAEEGQHALVFWSGTEYVAVCWNESEAEKFSIESAGDLIMTEMMGGKTTLEAKKGRVTFEISQDPVYISLGSSLPKSFVRVDYNENEAEAIANTEFTIGQRVIAVPEFDTRDYESEKASGHKIEDGTKLSIRLTNLNEQSVTGTIEIKCDGLTFIPDYSGSITVEAMSEIIVTGALTKIGNKPGTYLYVNGSFEGTAISQACCRVY